jgi:hypothetical protein
MKDGKALNYAIGNGTARSAFMKEDGRALPGLVGVEEEVTAALATTPVPADLAVFEQARFVRRAEELRRRLTPRRRRR